MYIYRVHDVARVIDGDTFDLDLDLGFYARLRVRVRLMGVDTYEIYGKNADPRGAQAKELAEAWMAERLATGRLRVQTYRLNPDTPTADGAFGRWLGTVFDGETDEWLSDALEDAGLVERSA